MADVYYSKSISEGFLIRLKQELLKEFEGCKKIAVKMHFGEPGNRFAFVPEDIEPIIKILNDMDIDLFMYDSSVLYSSPRQNPEGHMRVAIEKGFDKLGEIRTDDDFIEFQGENLVYEVCKPLTEVDAVLILTHFKGHMCCGFGGAIKNLGMGAVTNKSKKDIHEGAKPIFDGECDQCKTCENACPFGAIKVEDYPEFEGCFGCSLCTEVCQKHSIKTVVAHFETLLADSANCAQKNFKKYYYISFMKNIAQKCDCNGNSDKNFIIAKDSGILCCKDAVAIDKAAHDIVVENEGKDVFLKKNKKTGLKQVEEAERLGMGSTEFNLVEV
ncbi:MAG: DUF362 domain-containing protein [Candidatus Woesearchaeota archaeon]